MVDEVCGGSAHNYKNGFDVLSNFTNSACVAVEDAVFGWSGPPPQFSAGRHIEQVHARRGGMYWSESTVYAQYVWLSHHGILRHTFQRSNRETVRI